MRRSLRVIATILLLVVAAAAAFVVTYEPKSRPPLDITVEITPERVARGDYLANVALSCMACHAQRDWGTWGGPILGPVGAGGESWVREHGFPGRIFAPNLTPDPSTGLGEWTDGEILRAIREGIGREGQALFNLMPYTDYATLSDEDAYAVVAYLRSLPPVRREMPEREIDFPVSFFMKLAPRPLDGPVPEPDRDDPVAYGAYLTTVGGCRVCHTPVDWRHLPNQAELFAGGRSSWATGAGRCRPTSPRIRRAWATTRWRTS